MTRLKIEWLCEYHWIPMTTGVAWIVLFMYLVIASEISSSTYIGTHKFFLKFGLEWIMPPNEALVEFTGDLFLRIPYRKILIHPSIPWSLVYISKQSKWWENQPQSCQLSIHTPLGLIAPATRIGSRNHWVAVDQNKENVQSFGVYTQDHQHLIDHLRQYGITSVAMESTGSYWQTLFNALQKDGFEQGRLSGAPSRW